MRYEFVSRLLLADVVTWLNHPLLCRYRSAARALGLYPLVQIRQRRGFESCYRLIQQQMYEKWDGKLPTYVGGDASIPVLNDMK